MRSVLEHRRAISRDQHRNNDVSFPWLSRFSVAPVLARNSGCETGEMF